MLKRQQATKLREKAVTEMVAAVPEEHSARDGALNVVRNNRGARRMIRNRNMRGSR